MNTCDACGKPRRDIRFSYDANGDVDVGICFICVKEAERAANRDREPCKKRPSKRQKALVTGTRVECRKNPNGVRPDTYFANVWDRKTRAQLGHGEGLTRQEAIRNAKADAARKAG